MANGIGLRDIVGAAGFVSQQQEMERRRIFDEEVGVHLQGLSDDENYIPGSDYDARAFHMAQVDLINKQLGQENLKQAQFENAKADIDMQHRAISQSWLKAEGSLAVGNMPKFFDFVEESYETLADGTDMQIDRENNRIRFQNNTDDTTEWKEFTSQEKMVEFLLDTARPMMDKTTFAQHALIERQKINMSNADRWTEPVIYTNDKGDKLHAITKLLDPRTGKPFEDTFEGVEITDGVIFYDPKTGKMVSTKDAIRQGYLTLAEREKLATLETEKAKAIKAKQEGKAPSMSPEEKLADGLVRKGIYKSGEEAMRFAVAMTQAKNKNDFIDSLNSVGIDSDDPDYERFLKIWEAAQPQLPKRKEPKGLPGADKETGTKPSIEQRIAELKNIPGMTKAKAKKHLMEEYPEAFKK